MSKVVLVTVEGEIDMLRAEGFRTQLREATSDPSVNRIVVDMRKVTFLSAAGIAYLIMASQCMSLRQGRIDVIPSWAVRRLFDIVKMPDAVRVHGCPETAGASTPEEKAA